MSMSVSVCKGKGSMSHNNREFSTPNVDKSRTENNIIYIQEPIREAYQKLFGEAVAEYNSKQKRADRRIDDYMDKIQTSKNGEKLFYETVVQIGNQHDCGTLSKNGEMAAKVLDEYMKEFQDRNPNLYVFNAVLHLDEATPHLHIDWIPVAREYKQGLQVRNSLDKALKQQGIDGSSGKIGNSTQKWQDSEKNAVEAVMMRYGLEREAESGLHREKLTLEQYKTVVREIENQVAVLPEQITSTPVPMSKDKVIVSKTELEALASRAKLSLIHEKASKEMEQKIQDKAERQEDFLKNRDERIEFREKELLAKEGEYYFAKREYEQAKIDLTVRMSSKKEKYEALYQEQLSLNQDYAQLKTENQNLQVENQKLRGALLEVGQVNRNLNAYKEELEAQIGDLRAEITRIKQVATKQIKTMQKSFCEEIQAICQAVGLLKYHKGHYKADLTKEQERLVDAVSNYGANVARSEGQEDVARKIDKDVQLSDGVFAEIKRLEKKERSQNERER